MTLPKGFRTRKEELDSEIKRLENKLVFLNSKLDKNTNPYHIHHEYVNTLADIKRMDRTIDKKIKELESPKKGIKVKHLLIFGIVLAVIIIGVFISYNSKEIIIDDVSSIDVVVPPESLDPSSTMSSQCQKAYNSGPNKWYFANCQ